MRLCTLWKPHGPNDGTITWRDWDGASVAMFISAYCDLPQYASTAEKNLTGSQLHKLLVDGSLCKGLTRVGICDFDHQRRISVELLRLRRSRPDQVMRDLE